MNVFDRPAAPDRVADLARHVPVRRIRGGDLNTLLDREWLVTNGLGGYASGTVCRGGRPAATTACSSPPTPAPLGRVMMFNHLTEHFRLPGLPRRRPSAGRSGSAASSTSTAPSPRPSSGWRPACRSGGTRSTGTSSRSGSYCRTGRTPSTSRYRLIEGHGPGAAEAAAVGPLPRARRPGQPPARRRRTSSPPVEGRFELSAAGPRTRRCGSAIRRRRGRRSPSTACKVAGRPLPGRGEPRVRGRRGAVEPRRLPRQPASPTGR